jgi:hypothetical protein
VLPQPDKALASAISTAAEISRGVRRIGVSLNSLGGLAAVSPPSRQLISFLLAFD